MDRSGIDGSLELLAHTKHPIASLAQQDGCLCSLLNELSLRVIGSRTVYKRKQTYRRITKQSRTFVDDAKSAIPNGKFALLGGIGNLPRPAGCFTEGERKSVDFFENVRLDQAEA